MDSRSWLSGRINAMEILITVHLVLKYLLKNIQNLAWKRLSLMDKKEVFFCYL